MVLAPARRYGKRRGALPQKNSPSAAVRGAAERSLAVEGLLDNFFLHARVPDAVGRTAEPRALAPGRRLGAEVVEVLREPRRL